MVVSGPQRRSRVSLYLLPLVAALPPRKEQRRVCAVRLLNNFHWEVPRPFLLHAIWPASAWRHHIHNAHEERQTGSHAGFSSLDLLRNRIRSRCVASKREANHGTLAW